MEVVQIRQKIKGIIGDIANLSPVEIADDASFVQDLDLDSLALLEIAVDVDHTFRLDLPEERLQSLRTVADAVELVLERQVASNPAASVA